MNLDKYPLAIKPMKAASEKDDKIKKLLNDKNWIAEEKLDGSRYIAQIGKKGVRFFSRKNSVKNNKPVEKTKNIPHLSKLRYKKLAGTILDGEIESKNRKFSDVISIMGSLPERAIKIQKKIGKVRFKVFDILYYKGKNVQNRILSKRIKLRNKVINRIRQKKKNKFFKFIKSMKRSKEEFYLDIIKYGGEGIILKNLKGKYIQNERKKDIWIKLKKTNTYDVVITGYNKPKKWYAEPGKIGADGKIYPKGRKTKYWQNKLIGAIKYGLYKNKKLIEIGQCSGTNDDMREKFSRNKEKYIGKVMEIVAQEKFEKGGFRHANFLRLRNDKSAKECTFRSIKEGR